MSLRIQISLIITGIFAGFMTIIHLQSVPAASYSADNSEEKRYILETLVNEQNLLKSRIVSLRNDIDEKDDELKKFGGAENVEQLDALEAQLGLQSETGAGIEIIYDDSKNIDRETVDVNNEALVHAADLRDIVNVLNISGAEAIAINDQRILATTPISCVGNSILINNSHTAPPFRIAAITDYEVTKNNLTSNEYLGQVLQRIDKFGLIFKVYGQKQVNIPVYSGNFQLKYTQ